MNDSVNRHRAKRWLRYNVRRRPKIKDKKGVFTIKDFQDYLDTVFLSSYESEIRTLAREDSDVMRV
jgi:hypothetical protein